MVYRDRSEKEVRDIYSIRNINGVWEDPNLLHNDGWTITTIDNKPSAHFEHTIVVRKGKAEILSSFEEIEKKING